MILEPVSSHRETEVCSTTKCHQYKSDLRNGFVQKSFFSISSILSIPIMLIGINGGYFPAICRVCFKDFATNLNFPFLIAALILAGYYSAPIFF